MLLVPNHTGTYCVGGSASLLLPQACPAGAPPSPRLSSSIAQCAAPVAANVVLRVTAFTRFTPCPENTTTYGLDAAQSLEWCYPKPGYYYAYPGPAVTKDPMVVALCPAENYCPVVALRPQPCPFGAPFANPGATLFANCSATMSPPCRPGYFLPFSANGSSACAPCPPSCFCPNATLNVGACDPASNAAWYAPPQSTAAAQCVPSSSTNLSAACPFLTHAPASSIVSGSGGGTLPLFSALQCRANAGAYFVPGSSAGVPCPVGYYCPPDTLQPVPCATGSGARCDTPGFSTTPILCPGGTPAPLNPCTPCNAPALPATAYFPEPGVSCRVCCGAGLIKVSAASLLLCQAPPDSLSCTAGSYRPFPEACAASVPACQPCPPPPTGAMFLPLADLQALLLLQANGNASAIPGFGGSAYGVGTCAYTCQLGLCIIGTPNTTVVRRGANGTSNATATAAAEAGRRHYFTIADNPTLNTSASPSSAIACVVAVPGSIAPPSDGVCAPCPQGTYVAEYGGTACRTCPPGSSTTTGGGSTCVCAVGTTVPQASAGVDAYGRSLTLAACAPCPLGTVWAAGYVCQPCAPGTVCSPYQTRLAQPSCAPGYYRPTAVSPCLPCDPGTVSNRSDASACTPCPAGTYSTVDRVACAVCPNGTYSRQPQLAWDGGGCTPCPDAAAQSTSPDGTRSVAAICQ